MRSALGWLLSALLLVGTAGSLAIREKALGPEHPDVAESLNDLAVLYGPGLLHDHQGNRRSCVVS
jgi:hypothetical protein